MADCGEQILTSYFLIFAQKNKPKANPIPMNSIPMVGKAKRKAADAKRRRWSQFKGDQTWPTKEAARQTTPRAVNPDAFKIWRKVPCSRRAGWNTKAKGIKNPAIPNLKASTPVDIISDPARLAAAKAVIASGGERTESTA